MSLLVNYLLDIKFFRINQSFGKRSFEPMNTSLHFLIAKLKSPEIKFENGIWSLLSAVQSNGTYMKEIFV